MANGNGHYAERHERLLTWVELDNWKAAYRERLQRVFCRQPAMPRP